MKTIYKRLLTIVLVFALAISFTPIRTLAAKDNDNDKSKKEKVEYGTVVKANSGTISTIMYPGAKAKKASFKITSEKGDRYIDTNNNNKEYDCYEVTITLNKSKLSSKDINKSLFWALVPGEEAGGRTCFHWMNGVFLCLSFWEQFFYFLGRLLKAL